MGFTSAKSELSALGLHHPCHPLKAGLSNGVMVAQQVLVLFVVVRIRLGQLFNTRKSMRLPFLVPDIQ